MRARRLILTLIVLCLAAPAMVFAGTCRCPTNQAVPTFAREACCPTTPCAMNQDACPVQWRSPHAAIPAALLRTSHDCPQDSSPLDHRTLRQLAQASNGTPALPASSGTSRASISLPLRL